MATAKKTANASKVRKPVEINTMTYCVLNRASGYSGLNKSARNRSRRPEAGGWARADQVGTTPSEPCACSGGSHLGRGSITATCPLARGKAMIDDPVLIDDWHPVALVADRADGGPIAARVLGEDLVVWRSGEEFFAWRDLCVHRGTRLSLGSVVDGVRLECPYHGWTYGMDGQCVLMPAPPEQLPPAKARVATFHAAAAHDVVWVSLGSGARGIPKFELLDEPAYRVLIAGPYRVKASGPRIVENFLDIGHFPFVHEGILGDRARPEIEDYTTS